MTPQSPSQFGVCSWSMRAHNAQQLAEVCSQIGVKKVQLALVPHREDPGALDGVKEALAAKGITIVSGMFGTIGEDYTSPQTIAKTGGVRPNEHWEGNLKIAKEVAQRAAGFGLNMVMFHAGFVPHDKNDPEFKTMVDRVAAIAKVFAEKSIALLLETGQETADDLWTFLYALDAKGATNVAVNFDPANMILYEKGDPIAALKKLLPRVKSIHVKDAIKTKVSGTWGQEVPVGDGQVDWPAFLKVLSEGNYKGDLNIEREAGEGRINDAKKAIAHLTELMKV
ncbi:MAG: sugar phosphate isomerase/epimerase family protein [Phycisphaeraceae bacterium]